MKRLGTIVVALLLLCGCASSGEASATPGSPIPGFWTSGQEIGGGEEIQELNLRKVDAAISGGETLISLSFVVGSATSGGEEKPMNQTPAYKVQALDGPGRLLVTLPLAYRDYQGNEPEPVGLYTGMYAMVQDARSGETRIYFQFTGKVGFWVDKQKGALILHVEPENPDLGESYYASLDYSEQTRDIALLNGMHPVRCEDGENMLFLSQPFSSNVEADALAAQLNGQLNAAQLNHRAGVVTQSGNWAPTYQANISRDELEHLGALVAADGSVYSAQPWAVEARFLTWLPAGSGLCANAVTRTEGGEQVSFEQLWVYDAKGNRERFIDSEFAYVDRAAFSKDGRYLAFIERVETKRLLYLYDLTEKSLDFLSAEGMGSYTASFDWSDDGKLYALSGTETMQLMCFDPAKTGVDESRVSAVEERYGGAGSVFCAGGKVYINGDAAGTIYAVDPATGEREEFAQGDGFSISPDGRTMLITYYEEGGIDSQTGVKVRDMLTGDEMELTSGLTYHGSCWSGDGKLLGYLVSNYAQIDVTEYYGEDDEEDGASDGASPEAAPEADAPGGAPPDDSMGDYPARLYTYSPDDGFVKLLGVLASDLIYPGQTGSEVVLVAYHARQDGTMVPVTYRLALPE